MEQKEEETIRTKIIQTKFGSVFAKEVGQIGQPLILVIHGSGPKNSSAQYQTLLYQYVIRISYFEKFYILAIDCPGYGKSGGSKQAIKTFPRELLQEILDQLHYKNYYALFGHSQGGAAIFNAVFENPALCEVMVQERPVCGNIQRFRGFQVPTLLVYDIQDDGHPVWQGKLLFKQLKNSEFHTFRTSKTPYWATDNIWDLMIAFFDKWAKKREKSMLKENIRSVSTSTREISRRSLLKNRQAQSLNKKPKKLIEKQQIQELEESFYSVESYNKNYEKKEELIIKQKKNDQINKQVVILREQSQKIIQKHNLQQEKIVQIQKPILINQNQKQIQPKKIQEIGDDRCSICHQTFYHPTKINCHHIFCWKCITEAMLVNSRCPLCRKDITKRNQLKEFHEELINKMSKQNLNKKVEEYSRFNKMMQSIVFIEMGNTSMELQTKKSHFTNTKKKFNWELFVVEPKNFKFQSVEFNINMGNVDVKPIKVKSPPWTYSSRGTFSFSCEITINPKSNQYAKQVVIYRINIEQGRHTKRIAVRKKQFI